MTARDAGAAGVAGFERMWADLEPIGRHSGSGGYRRFAWTRVDATLEEWFAGACEDRGLEVDIDAAGNQWAWWGDPDAARASGAPGIAVGSHLDSVPDGGAFDGPLGVVSALAALDSLRAAGFVPARPLGVVHFKDEEGARFGVACAGSRIITGALPPDRALALLDADGVPMGEAMSAAGHDVTRVGRDARTLARVGAFVELHVEQGRALAPLGRPVAVGTSIRPHGRWRFELTGEANHAGTTALADRSDALLAFAGLVQQARGLAERHGVLATCGKVLVEPNGVNAIPAKVTGWLDARGGSPAPLRAMVEDFALSVAALDGTVTEESWTGATTLDRPLADRVAATLGEVPRLPTGAGHDAGILADAGIPTAMLFVRNPTGISHSPREFAEAEDCHRGVAALAGVIRELSR